MSGKTIANDLTSGSVTKQLLIFSFPIMMSNLFQTLYSLVDMVIVGRFVGSTGLSAVGIGGEVLTLFLCVGMSIGQAGQILIAQQTGAKDYDGMSHSVGTIITLEIIAGIGFGILCLSACNPVLHLLNTPEEAWTAARNYTLMCGCGMLFVYGYNALSAVLRGMGESRLPMIAIFVAQVINLILDLLFVAVLHMGAGGAALATVIGQSVSLIATLIYLIMHKERLGFTITLKHLKIQKKYFVPLIKLAMPMLAQELLITGSMTVINSMVNSFGVTASAVDAVGQKLNNVMYIGIDGMAIGTSAMVGQCFGAGDHERIKKIVHSCTAFCLIFATVVCALLVLFCTPIFAIFTSDPTVIAMAPKYIWVTVVNSFASASMCSVFGVVEGVGFATFAMLMSILDGVVARIGLGFVMGNLFGLFGYWFGSGSAGFVTTIMAGIYYLSGSWMHRKPLMAKETGNTEDTLQ